MGNSGSRHSFGIGIMREQVGGSEYPDKNAALPVLTVDPYEEELPAEKELEARIRVALEGIQEGAGVKRVVLSARNSVLAVYFNGKVPGSEIYNCKSLIAERIRDLLDITIPEHRVQIKNNPDSLLSGVSNLKIERAVI